MSGVRPRACPNMTSRQAQKSSPSARPRMARWNAWLCTFTNPGSESMSGTGARLPLGPLVVTRAVPAPLAQLPNALTVVRLGLIPVFVALAIAAGGASSWPAGAVFGAAGITDQIDGWLARRWRVESEFGRFADPLADRLMIDAAVVLLWLDGRLPWPALAIILVRDVALLGGYGLVMNRGYEFSVSALGKAATWMLYAGLTGVLASDEGTVWPLTLFWAGVGLAVAAAVLYVVNGLGSLRR